MRPPMAKTLRRTVGQQRGDRVEFGMVDLAQRRVKIAHHRIGKTVENMGIGHPAGPAVMLGEGRDQPLLDLGADRRSESRDNP